VTESFSESSDEAKAEPDVQRDEAQVEPDSDDSFVGRASGADEGYAGETGAEARAQGSSDNDAVEGGPRH
jgi:hypothetical protein